MAPVSLCHPLCLCFHPHPLRPSWPWKQIHLEPHVGRRANYLAFAKRLQSVLSLPSGGNRKPQEGDIVPPCPSLATPVPSIRFVEQWIGGEAKSSCACLRKRMSSWKGDGGGWCILLFLFVNRIPLGVLDEQHRN